MVINHWVFMPLDITIFNIGLGQCIYFEFHSHPLDNLMVDCGHTLGFNPIQYLISNKKIRRATFFDDYKLNKLILTNLDHDHFSNINYLINKVKVEYIEIANNITYDELASMKPEITPELIKIGKFITENKVSPTKPPYSVDKIFLTKEVFNNQSINTNDLSQMVFIKYNGTRICIPGDLSYKAWNKILIKKSVQRLLRDTEIFIASHHGRIDGYHSDIFKFCKPECIIISDELVRHRTQSNRARNYGRHVPTGFTLEGINNIRRKVLITGSDGHINIRVNPDRTRNYAIL